MHFIFKDNYNFLLIEFLLVFACMQEYLFFTECGSQHAQSSISCKFTYLLWPFSHIFPSMNFNEYTIFLCGICTINSSFFLDLQSQILLKRRWLSKTTRITSLSSTICNIEKLKGRNVESKHTVVQLFLSMEELLVSISLILNSEDFSQLLKGPKLRVDWLIFLYNFPHFISPIWHFRPFLSCIIYAPGLSIVNASILPSYLSREFSLLFRD